MLRIACGCALLLLAFTVRTAGISRSSIWVDDTWSLAAATGHSLDVHLNGMTAGENYGVPDDPKPASYFLQYIAPQPGNNVGRVVRDSYASESHPPLFYVLLHLWMEVFGYSVSAARALSLFASLAAIPLLFFLARRLAGETAGWIACLLFILAPFQSLMSLQIRSYTLVGLLVLATSSLTLKMLDDGATPRRVVLLITLGIAGMLLHYYFFLYSFVQGTALLTQKRLWKTALLVGAAWTATLAMLAVYIHYQPSFLAQPWMHTYWYPPLLLLNGASALSELLAFNLNVASGRWIPAALLLMVKAVLVSTVAFLLLLANRRLPQIPRIFLLAWMIVPVLLIFLSDVLRESGTVMQPRYIMGSSFALYLLLAVGLANLSVVPRSILLAAIVIPMLGGQFALRVLPVGSIEEGSDFQLAAQTIRAGWKPGDLVVAQSSYGVGVISLAYYLPPETPILSLVYLPRPADGPVVIPRDLTSVGPRLDRWAANRRRVWVVSSYTDQSIAPLFNWLAQHYRVAQQDHYGGAYVGEWAAR